MPFGEYDALRARPKPFRLPTTREGSPVQEKPRLVIYYRCDTPCKAELKVTHLR